MEIYTSASYTLSSQSRYIYIYIYYIIVIKMIINSCSFPLHYRIYVTIIVRYKMRPMLALIHVKADNRTFS